jgi:integrase
VSERLRVYIGPRRKRKGGGFYPKWPYRYQLPGQPWVHGTGAFTEASTRQIVDGLIQEHLLKLKMADRGIGGSDAPIEKHILDYLNWGKHGGGRGGLPWSQDHFNHRRSQLAEWTRKLGLKTLSDVRYDSFSAVNTAQLESGLAPNTVNHHAFALVAFIRWCHERKRILLNPLENFTSLDKRARRERGAFTASELQALLEAAPPGRRRIYLTAALTGFRRSALASLQVHSVDWLSSQITLQWGAAKNRKTTVKPLPAKLLADLEEACAGKPPEASLLDFHPLHAARDIHRDMQKAGIPILKDGRRRDFHSLKVSLGTLLDDLGTPPEITQKALDHASFRQTQGYIKRDMGALRTVIEDLERRLNSGDKFHARPAEAHRVPVQQAREESGRGLSHSDPSSSLLESAPPPFPPSPGSSSAVPPVLNHAEKTAAGAVA